MASMGAKVLQTRSVELAMKNNLPLRVLSSIANKSGTMIVRVWQNDYDLIDETILHAGDFTQVKPGVYHQFEGVEDGVAFELYWAEFNHDDIQRESVGYKKNGRPAPIKDNPL